MENIFNKILAQPVAFLVGCVGISIVFVALGKMDPAKWILRMLRELIKEFRPSLSKKDNLYFVRVIDAIIVVVFACLAVASFIFEMAPSAKAQLSGECSSQYPKIFITCALLLAIASLASPYMVIRYTDRQALRKKIAKLT